MNTPRRTSRTALVAASGGLALALTTLPAQAGGLSAQADDTTYVALGDSFSAGTGTRASTDDCYRSPYGYPALIAGAQGLDLDYQACSGATTADVLNHQVGTLSPETDLVTMTIGGNDLGFADVITECALPGWLSNCTGAINGGLSVLRNQLPARYDAVLGAIDAGAPNADVRIGGYPLLFNGEDCNLLTFFSGSEMSRLNAATHELDRLVQQKTTGAGHTFVDPRAAFDNHAVCDDVEWVNGLSWPIVESFHPNRAGNIGYAEVFWPGSGTASTAAVPTGARPSLTARVQAEADAVLAMDLDSRANLRAAARAGISPQRISQLVDRLESGDVTTVTAALEELSELDRQHEAKHGSRRG
ncbi:SGNH/GDSL hydrolase family protein [Ornithinimicrobium sp. F0845]|uniref:SGNH/GDSL hydrolase family protein n=1 Tax=Ornithinimicrobium sp. F0845 TaxID=2926412 RepID=UPI001FF21003|nr:SGNH/GDSL hydrolase family protein [Ornithinimicrobium sp. F0845]